jgi:predicted dehydrogenase
MQTEEEVALFAEQVNSALLVKAKELMGEDMGIPLGASVGAVFVPMHGDNYDSLFRLADQAMYEVKKNGKAFHLGYMYRYSAYVTELLSQVRNGELGDIISVEAPMNCIHPEEVRQWLSCFKGGMMFFLGCHLIDLIIKIQGMPERITPYNRSSGLDGVTAEDFGMAVLEYKNGVSFAKTVACEVGGFERRQLVVTGTKKTVELKPLEWCSPEGWGQSTYRTEYTSCGWWDKGEKSVSPAYDRYDNMMRAFASYCRGDAVNPDTPDSELELFKATLVACGIEV